MLQQTWDISALPMPRDFKELNLKPAGICEVIEENASAVCSRPATAIHLSTLVCIIFADSKNDPVHRSRAKFVAPTVEGITVSSHSADGRGLWVPNFRVSGCHGSPA